ncbi:MAG TPA: carboxypeptidase regulatory-like domain-containing protein [Bryobacteraceae bacterium]|nr:carboxypeptidase regulatory-like domain-containing protein [Bryobacteraceae bacterium]
MVLRTRAYWPAFFLFCAFAWGTFRLTAQVYSGSLTGVVTDASGGVIPSAKVTLTDVDKGFIYNGATGADGRYVLRNLPPGRYNLQVESPGLKTYNRTGISLNVGQNAQADVSMEVAGATQTVEVSATSEQLNTQDATTGQVVSRNFINDLPLVSRSVFNLTELAPGVTQPPGSSFGLNQGALNFVSNGGRNSTADLLIDGVSETNYENNSGITNPLYTPSVDAVQEFKLQQNNYTAETGFSGNSVINVVLRSGTNEFHGSAYEFFQNSDLNANNFFNNLNGLKLPSSGQNQFGGTLGGPIRKDRTFFFVDYQGTRTRSTSTVRAGVPSASERAGNFGEVCAAHGGTFNVDGLCSAAAGQIWDPMTSVYSPSAGGAVRGAFVPFNNLATYVSPGNPQLAGTPYQLPGTPGNLMDPVALKMMQYYPLPNVAVGTAQYNPLNNWIGAGGSHSQDDRFDIKVDQRFNDANMLSARYSESLGHSEGVNCFGNVADPCTQGPNHGASHNVALNYTHTFTATTVLNVTYGFARSYSHTGGVATDFPSFNPVTSLGLPSYFTASGYTATPAVVVQGGYQQVGGNTGVGSQEYSILQYPLDTHDFHTDLDKVVGRHEFKIGYEGRFHRISFLQVGLPEGAFTFNNQGTSQTPSATSGGDALASFLTGFPQSGSYGIDVAITTQNFQHAWYFQDNWRANDRLTVNLGLRYELTLPRTERYNRMSWVDPSAASPLQVPSLGTLHGGLEFASNSNPSPYNVDPMNFGPRVGVAYRFFRNTVVRAGYGIFFDPIKGGASGTGGGGFTGFNFSTPVVTTYQGNGATPWGRMSNPFPGTGPTLPPGNSLGLLTGVGLGISGPIRYWNATPYMQTWSLDIQHELPGSVLLDVGYVGTKGTHLYFGGAGNINYLGSGVESLSSSQIAQLNSYVPNPFYGIITNPASTLSAATVQQYQLDRPYPQFTGLSGNDPPWANSIYNALQVRVEKQFSHGFQALATYTYSKSIDDASVACGCTTWLGGFTSVQDPNKLFLERSVSEFDIPQVLQFSYVYSLPFGRGKQFGNNWNYIVDTLLGGWQTNGIWRFDDGFPIQLSLNGGQALPTYGTQRPNLTGTLTRNNGSNWMNSYFADPQAAVVPAPFTVGDAPRELSTARAPGTATTALSLFKQIPWSKTNERRQIEIRLEAFNALNHPQFAAPNAQVNTTTFGKVTAQANIPRQVQLALKLYF